MESVRSLFLFESSPDKFTILVRVMLSRNFFSICPFLWRKTVKCIYLVVLYVFFYDDARCGPRGIFLRHVLPQRYGNAARKNRRRWSSRKKGGASVIGTGAVYSVNQKVRSHAWTVPQNSHDTAPQTAAQKKPYTGRRQDALPPRAMGRAMVPVALGTMKEKLTV